MRVNIVHIGAAELNYEIRQIVEVGHQVAAFSGRDICWENIGDPIQKGEKLPDWIKEIVSRAVHDDQTYAYSPTRGLTEARQFLAERSNSQGGIPISPDDIIFFNGLGDAVNKIYYLLRREARVIGPSPAYPTHSSAEAGHAGYPPITYRLDPHNNWMPDLEELHNKVKYNDSIAGILIINPDNPTGAVFPKEVVREMIEIARRYKLFIVADETYTNMVYRNIENYAPLANLIGDLPAISLKGISKELPWPGARCGWMKVYNRDRDSDFRRYIDSIINAKMLEVCSTTLPQKVLPQILGDSRWPDWQRQRNSFFKRRSEKIEEIFKDCPGVMVNIPDGAFYLSVVFNNGIRENMRLRIEDPKVSKYIDSLGSRSQHSDFRFVYDLLGAYNICVVPLSSFVTNLRGFRSTLLERDDKRFEATYRQLVNAVGEFINSG